MEKFISRRTMLRGILGGAAVSLGLPVLEAMLNRNGTALASGEPLPLRYGQWFWGCGVLPKFWVPSTTGTNWTPSEELAPLAAVQKYVSVVTNTAPPSAGGFFHWMGQGVILSGSYDAAGPPFGQPGAKSFDQTVAQAWAGKTAIPSVAVGVAQKGFSGQNTPDVSWLGDKQPNTVQFSPVNLYKAMFGSFHKDVSLVVARRSVLSLVAQDMNNLRGRVGAADVQRLDQHAQSVRDMENTLTEFLNNSCAAPSSPTDPMPGANFEPLVERNQLFSDMLALALACDLTRVFAVQFTSVGTNVIFSQVGATDGHHNLSHNPSAAAQSSVRKGIVFTMQQLAYLVQKLAATPEGTGSVLDNTCLFATSDIGDGSTNGNTHTNSEYPLLLIGGAGGALKPGQHYRPPTELNSQQALVTIATALKLPKTNFGSATQPFGPLLA